MKSPKPPKILSYFHVRVVVVWLFALSPCQMLIGSLRSLARIVFFFSLFQLRCSSFPRDEMSRRFCRRSFLSPCARIWRMPYAGTFFFFHEDKHMIIHVSRVCNSIIVWICIVHLANHAALWRSFTSMDFCRLKPM